MYHNQTLRPEKIESTRARPRRGVAFETGLQSIVTAAAPCFSPFDVLLSPQVALDLFFISFMRFLYQMSVATQYIVFPTFCNHPLCTCC